MHPATTVKRKPPSVTRGEIILRGVLHRCPNCGHSTLFEPGHYFSVSKACSHCGMRWDKDEAAFLGSVTLNYGVTVFALLLPWLTYAWSAGVSTPWTIASACLIALFVPVALFRPSKSWWLMCYYLFLPHHLPANWPDRPSDELPPDE